LCFLQHKMKSREITGATIKRRGVAAQTKAWCHPHTGGEDRPGTATTKAAKASNSNERGRNETPSASGVDKNKRLLPLLTRFMPMKVQEGGSKKRKVPRQGGGNLRIPTREEKQGWPKRVPPQCEKQGCGHQACPTKRKVSGPVLASLSHNIMESMPHSRGVLTGELARA